MLEKVHANNNESSLSSTNGIYHMEHLQRVFEHDIGAHQFPQHMSNETIVRHFCAEADAIDDDQPFYIVDLSHFIEQTNSWKRELPRVEPFYAVKCNPATFVIRTLYELNINFDCASEEELKLVLQTCPEIDCAQRIIYAHPSKPVSHIRRFRDAGVQLTTVDNIDELYKIKKYWPNAKVLLRLKVADTTALLPLSFKFGANEDECIRIMQLAFDLNVSLVGCCFHAGTPCHSPIAYKRALEMSHRLFDIADRQFNMTFTILDIGGGFNPNQTRLSDTSQTSELSFTEMASSIRDTIDQLFPLSRGIRLIAEPGRYFVLGCATLVCRVISRRRWKNSNGVLKDNFKSEAIIKNPLFKVNNGHELTRITPIFDEPDIAYYLNEGMYGIFLSFLLEPDLTFRLNWFTRKRYDKECPVLRSVLFGPTCDSRDLITPSIDLPLLEIGDVFYISHAGSYTNACTTSFNGFLVRKYVLIWRQTS